MVRFIPRYLILLGAIVNGIGSLISLFFLRFYLFIHDREREREAETQAEGEGEKQAPCREPDAGLDPGSPGSHPGLKAALNR